MCQLADTLEALMFADRRPTTWEAVRADWQAREQDVWRAHYQDRGFDSWVAWRDVYVRDFGLADRVWTVERLEHPLESVPGFFVGAFQGWRRYYPEGKTAASFSDIARHPEIRQNTGVRYWLDHIPERTQMIVFRCGEEIVVRDGTHRCAAMAVSAVDGIPFSSEVEAAVAEFSPGEHELFLRAVDQLFAKHVDSH